MIGGLASRSAPFARVALIGQIGGFVVTALFLLVLPSSPAQGADLVWGACSGIGTGTAMVFLFRGLSRGAMTVVVPVSAVGGVVLPVLVGVALLGDRPAALTWVGALIAVPALWFLSGGSGDSASTSRIAVLDGLAASGGIAVQYLCLAQASSGLWPILSGRAAAVATILVATMIFLGSTDEQASSSWRPRILALSIGAGVLAAAGLTAYLFALSTESVTVAVVLSSLYPVVPVLVGLLFLGERLRRSQGSDWPRH